MPWIQPVIIIGMLMKGNTEDVGSIFGSQPNQNHGNIHNVADSSEMVIGYIGAGSIQQQRIFIKNSECQRAGTNRRIARNI